MDAQTVARMLGRGADYFEKKWPDVTLLTIDLLAPYLRQIEGASKKKQLVLMANAPPFRIMLNASNQSARVDHRNTLLPWELRFLEDADIAGAISFLAGPDGALAVFVDDGLSEIAQREKAREVEDRIIEALKAEIVRRGAA